MPLPTSTAARAPGRPPMLLPVLLLVAALACGHEDPFEHGDYTTEEPHDGAFPRRLTFGSTSDPAPAWLPDGSGLVYSSIRFDQEDGDRCLAFLPAEGGQIRHMLCAPSPISERHKDWVAGGAPSADGRLVYLHAVLPLMGRLAPFWDVLIGTVDGGGGVQIGRFPVAGPDGTSYDYAAQLQWLNVAMLVGIGQQVAQVGGNDGPVVATGRGVLLLRLGDRAMTVDVVSGTADASSVSVGESEGVIYYTVNGDSRIYRRVLAEAGPTVVWDFGPGRIARGVRWAAGRFVAIVGGDVSWELAEPLGFIQLDFGGELHLVDPAAGIDQRLGDPAARYSAPVLDPTGTRIVSEAAISFPPEPGFPPTFTSPDLWLLEAP